VCGRFAVPHLGQTLEVGAFSFQFAAWRMRPLALDFFFFGTAIANSAFVKLTGNFLFDRALRLSGNHRILLAKALT